jgi:hypothetical protein
MKCSNPYCSRGIGLVSHRRGWIGKGRYCSRKCRDTFVAPNQLQRERCAATYFEWLWLETIDNPQPQPAFVCAQVTRGISQ